MTNNDSGTAPAPQFPFPQRVEYTGPDSESLLTKPSVIDQAEMEKKILNLYKAILDNNLIVDSNGPLGKNDFRMVVWHSLSYEAADEGDRTYSHITTSESMGYGMLFTVFMAGCEPELNSRSYKWILGCTSIKDYYDAMLRTVLEYPSVIAPHLFAWELEGLRDRGEKYDWGHRGYKGYEIKNGIKQAPFTRLGDGDCATDGDMDIIYSLLLADKQWGSAGSFDYKGIALKKLDDFWKYCVHDEYHTLLLGDWAKNSRNKAHKDATRPSDFIISHLKTFKAVDTAHDWQAVIDATYNVIKEIRDEWNGKGYDNGLLPDFIERGREGWIVADMDLLEGMDGLYAYNACRVPWRLGTDYLLFGNTAIGGKSLFDYIIKPLDELAAKTGGPGNFGPLDMTGNRKGEWWDWDDPETFTSPFLVTAAASGNQALVNELWLWRGFDTFFNDTWGDYIKLIVMLTASGNYWLPFP